MPTSSEKELAKIIQAVRAVGAGEYSSAALQSLLKQEGELGQLAHAVDEMAHGVLSRDHQLQLLRRVIPVGVSLSAEKDFNRLLETLVVEAQSVTNADAGTLYLLEDKTLRFVILRNTSLKLMMGGTSKNEITLRSVRLFNEDGSENRANVASYAALTRQRVHIVDAYETEGFDFSGTKSFDAQTGYHSKSFLTIPLEGKEKEVIGVLQLINAKDADTGEIIPFADDDVLEALILLASAALDGYIREESLRQEIAKLRIEVNESHRAKQVSEITDTQYFQILQEKARELRSKHK